MTHISHFIDLTSLKDDRTDNIKELVELSFHSNDYAPAAICTWPEHITQLNSLLYETKRVSSSKTPLTAAVLNFPSGDEDPLHVHNDCVFLTEEEYVNEIDYVFDWHAWKSGRKEDALSKLRKIDDFFCFRSEIKVILESGAFVDDLDTLREMCRAILDLNGAAAFLKTSTGKYPVGATLETARVIMEEVRNHNNASTETLKSKNLGPLAVPCGVKISGGVRTLEDATAYLDLATEIFGEDWVNPENFRFGASSLYEVVCDIKPDNKSYSY